MLFLCTFAPFGLGYAKYSFQNRCEENQGLCLRDGTEKIFYNCVSSSEEVPEHLKELLHDDDVREEGRNLLLALISKMTAGGDGDKIVQLENPEVLETMQGKYGLVLQPCKK